MRYLKTYRLFESEHNNGYEIYDITDIVFDADTIDDFYKSNYKITEEDYNTMGQNLFNYIKDETSILDDLKGDYVSNNNNPDDESDRFERYIKSKFIAEKYVDLDISDTVVARDFIEEEDGDFKDFLNWCWDDNDVNLQSYLSGLYGDEDLYGFLVPYLNFEELDDDLITDESEERKLEYYINNNNNTDVMETLFEEDEYNIVYMFDIKPGWYDTTDLQNKHIIKYCEINMCSEEVPIIKMMDYDKEIFTDEIIQKYSDTIEPIQLGEDLEKFNI